MDESLNLFCFICKGPIRDFEDSFRDFNLDTWSYEPIHESCFAQLADLELLIKVDTDQDDFKSSINSGSFESNKASYRHRRFKRCYTCGGIMYGRTVTTFVKHGNNAKAHRIHPECRNSREKTVA